MNDKIDIENSIKSPENSFWGWLEIQQVKRRKGEVATKHMHLLPVPLGDKETQTQGHRWSKECNSCELYT